MVRLSDLEHLPRPGSQRDNFEDFIRVLDGCGVRWPVVVARDVLFDHGHKDHMIRQYDHLDLRVIRWVLTALPASELVNATSWYGLTVEAQHTHWKIDRYRSLRRDAWDGTWAVPPYLIDGALLQTPQVALHVVEGHTRIGILTGLVTLGEMDPLTQHKVWIATRTADAELGSETKFDT